MDKLTLKHLSAYLPYEVKFISEMDKPYDEYGTQPIWTLNGINEMFFEHCLITKGSIDAYPISKCKLRLRPLSQLTRKIEHNGERFVPMDELRKISDAPYSKSFRFEEDGFKFTTQVMHSEYGTHQWLDYDFYSNDQYEMYSKLFEWHFDVFGLIVRGLAVDINTLKGG